MSCVDCNQTFYGEEYSSHNKCISEAEKYMGKLYKPGSTSTEGSKQDRWQSSVMEVGNSSRCCHHRCWYLGVVVMVVVVDVLGTGEL